MATDILSADLGLEGILSPAEEGPALPGPRPMAYGLASEPASARHFDLGGLSQMIDQALAPKGIEERLLAPGVFKRNLRGAYEKLSASRHEAFRRLAQDDLAPIMEDEELYQLYAGLLVGS